MRKTEYLPKILFVALVMLLFLPWNNTGVYAANYSLAINDSFVSGNITEAREIDYYTISLPSAGWLTLTYQGWSIENSYIELWNGSQTKKYYEHNVYNSSDTNPVTYPQRIALEGGTYIAKVYGNGSKTGSYKIKAAFEAADNNETEPNNFFAEAMPLPINDRVTGFISEDDKNDFYAIEAPADTAIRVTIKTWTGYSGLAVYDSECILKQYEEASGQENKAYTATMDVDVKKGVNYIKVEGWRGKYQLKWERLVTPVSEIRITRPSTVNVGSSVNLEASVSPDTADNKVIKWISHNPSRATVDDTGKVTGIKAGDVTIRAEATDGSGVYSEYNLNVQGVSITNISIIGSNSIKAGSSTVLKAIITPDDASNKTVTWYSDDTSIATVDSNGLVKGISEGTVYIFAEANDGSGMEASFMLVVESSNVPVTGVNITGENTITTGGTTTLKARVFPDDATNKNLTWSSSDTSVAEVEDNGKVTGKEPGITRIRATAVDGSGIYGEFALTVTDNTYAVTKIVISGEKTLKVGKSIKLTAKVSPDNATNKKVRWTSSKDSVATVTNTGKVVAKKAGKTKIKAEAEDGSGVYGSYTITVIKKNDDPASSKIVKKVTSVTVKSQKGKKVKVSWKKQSSAIRYEIQISTEKSFKEDLVAKTAAKNKNSLSIKYGKKGNAYVRVRAVDKFGYVGKWSSKKSVKIK